MVIVDHVNAQRRALRPLCRALVKQLIEDAVLHKAMRSAAEKSLMTWFIGVDLDFVDELASLVSPQTVSDADVIELRDDSSTDH